jgi:cytosine/adenosine deaminase-related metal-dependent hydrolase/NAD(P)-dependent dehydrogenase (short-subunit alcohol dehydrogenase family)
MDPEVGEIPNGDVLVEDGVIVEIGRGLEVGDAEEVDASGMIVMPGFVDTHRHTWQTPVRGVLPSCTLDHYFAVMLGSVGGHYRPEDVHIGDYAGSLEALNAGVTTLLDWSHISNTPDHSDAAIQGLKDAGIRAVYAHGMPTGGEWWSFSELEHPEDIRRIRDTYFSSDDGLLTLAMAARQPGNSNFDVAKHDWALARELGILISVHVGMRLHNLHYNPVKDMHDLGLMGPDVCYIHMTDLTDQELDWIAETGGKASIAPYVEMLMGHGPPPTGKLVARGVRPSLSVDVVSSVPGEMFTQMRTALAYDRICEFTDTPDEAFAPALSHRDVLEFATIDGARACGLDDRTGSLAPGKQADIVLLQTEAINTAPMVDPLGTIVVFSDTSNVDSVFVAGNAVKRNGQLVGHDLKSVFRKLDESRNHILGEGGLLPDWAAESAAPACATSLRRPGPRIRTGPSPRKGAAMANGSVVVVGGTVGLGRELAQAYADEGRDVDVTGREQGRAESAASEIGGSARGLGFDLAEPHSIAGALADVGSVDHLVLAAIERDVNKVQEYDIAGALRLVTLKLVGYTEVIHTLVPRLGEDSSILIFGGLARDRPYPGSTTVTTVNGGVTSMVRTLVIELAPRRVNAIHPAIVGDSPQWIDMPPERRQALVSRTPIGRLVTMAEVVGACRVLLENKAINGINLSVDGGWMCM